MVLIEEIEKKISKNSDRIDYIMLSPMQKFNIPQEWRKSEGLEMCGKKIIWNIENKDDEIIYLKKV